MNMAKRPVEKIDFGPYGSAIKAARTGQKESRNKVGDEMYLSPRYLANIENKGQHPSLQIFFELMSRYHISVDQFLFGDTTYGKTTLRRQLDALADELTDRKSELSLPPYKPCWMPEKKGSNHAPDTTGQRMRNAMNE